MAKVYRSTCETKVLQSSFVAGREMRARRDLLDPRAPFSSLMDGWEWREVVHAAEAVVSRPIKAALERLSIS